MEAVSAQRRQKRTTELRSRTETPAKKARAMNRRKSSETAPIVSEEAEDAVMNDEQDDVLDDAS